MAAPTVQWIKQNATFDTPGLDLTPSIALYKGATSSDDRIYVTYRTNNTVSGGTNSGSLDIIIFKMNPDDGSTEWTRQLPSFNTSAPDHDAAIAVDSIGNAYVAYKTSGSTSGNSKVNSNTSLAIYDLAIVKLDSNGIVQWVRQNDIFNAVIGSGVVDPGITIAAGTSHIYVTWAITSGDISGNSFSPNNRIIVMSMDFNGNVEWVIQQPDYNTPSGNSLAPSVAVDAIDNIFVEYFTAGTTSGNTATGLLDTAIFKLNSSGVLQWIKQSTSFNTNLNEGLIGTEQDYLSNRITTDNTGNVYAIYISRGTVSGQVNIGVSDIVVAKFDGNNGDLLWIRESPSFNTAASDLLPSIAYDSTTDTIVAAYQTDGTASGSFSSTGNDSIVVFSLDSSGNTLWTLQNYTFNSTTISQFAAVAAHHANAYIAYSSGGGAPGSGNTNVGSFDTVVFKLAPLVCLAGDTLITMIDGSLKEIQNIKRGDITSTGHMVAKLRKEPHHHTARVDLITFEPGCLRNGLPHQKIIVTPAHPIFYKGARIPASCFVKRRGVKLHKNCVIGDFFNTKETVYLYDLQFDHDGSYIANGVEVQSRSPRSNHTALEKELYFDRTLYTDRRIMNDFQTDHQLPLIAR